VSSTPVRLCAGLMSGTSIDAVDGVLAAFPLPAGNLGRPDAASSHHTVGRPRTLAFRSRAIPATLRDALQALQHPGVDELARAALAANALAELYAQVLADLLHASGHAPADVAAVGAHGQTVRHRPDLGYTLQLLNPALLAERAGIDVVADLRTADVAAGGQGAPLAPGFHAEVFASPDRRRAIVNLGGIANVSLIAAGMGCAESGWSAENATSAAAVLGCDTGPANTLLDLWCERHTGAAFDADGEWAAGGRVLEGLLARFLEEPYFSLAAPKSTGRDLFGARWLEKALSDAACTGAAPRDVQATLAELTAVTVARPCQAFGAEEVWVCGGGARNADLMRRISRIVAPASVAGTDALGIDPQAVEACAFAWLAHRHLSGLAGNLPAVTGAAGPRVLGALWPAPLRA
jgi:anhydro-N-acetylmuramic acid kinase